MRLRSTSPRGRITAALVGLLVLVLVGWAIKGCAAGGTADSNVPGASSGLQVEPLSQLPSQAKQTWKLIQSGGPFPYPHNDGVVFHNNGDPLPSESDGYYHEYTVTTPGSRTRGARRLITGEQHELYYTGDHYKSFVVVDPNH